MPSPPKKDQYEYLRFRSWELHQKGWKQNKIAEALGVKQSTISKWICKANKSGIDSLHTKKAAGPTPKLTTNEINLLRKHIKIGAQYHGFSDNRWTNQRIQKVIRELFEVDYSIQHIGRILKK